MFPAQIEDCKAAIRWLRANATKYRLDAAHIGVWGASAGAYLASLLGTTGGVKEFEGTRGNLEQSSRVQAVVDWFGPADFTMPYKVDREAASMVALLIGRADAKNQEKFRRASPITYVGQRRRPVSHYARRRRRHCAGCAERVACRSAEEGRRGGEPRHYPRQWPRRHRVWNGRKLEVD